MLGTIPLQGYQMSLLRTFWWENELSKLFGSRDRILPKYGHGRGRFGICCLVKKFCNHSDIVAKHVPELFQLDLAVDLKMHTASGWGTRVSGIFAPLT